MKIQMTLGPDNDLEQKISDYYSDLKNILDSILIMEWGLPITNTSIYVPQQRVNFFLKCDYQDASALIKLKMGGRSILFGFEQWQKNRPLFIEQVKNYMRNKFHHDKEAEALNIYNNIGIPSVNVLFSRGNVLIMEYLSGQDLGQAYGNANITKFLPEYGRKVADILLGIVNIKETEISSEIIFSEEGSLIYLPHFREPIQLTKDEFSIAFTWFTRSTQLYTIHTDFKPSNIIIMPNGDIRVIDGENRIGPIEFDIGKFIIRSLIEMNSSDVNSWEEYTHFLVGFYKTFITEKRISDEEEFLRRSLFLGCIEARRISQFSGRPGEKEMLGNENTVVRNGIWIVHTLLEKIISHNEISLIGLIQYLRSSNAI